MALEATPRQTGLDRTTKRRPLKRILKFFSLALLAGAIGAGALLRAGVVPGFDAKALRGQLDDVARFAGFGIDMVALTGHRQTADSDIFDALDLPNARSLMSFDTEGVRRRLERLPWVRSADVTRVFPDRLDVTITERKPYAIWMRDGRPVLIDETGRVLTAINRADGLNLPRISGEGAPEQAAALFAVLAGNPALAARMATAERVSGRRWTLHLTNGVKVHLPVDREQSAIASLMPGQPLATLLATNNQVIDLRAPGRIAVRPSTKEAG